jgi:hypothetical protein
MKIGENEVVVISNNAVKVGCQSMYRTDIEAVLKLMDEWKPAPAFQVGDFVRVAGKRKNGSDDADTFLRGRCGKVLEVDTRNITVEFAEYHRSMWGASIAGSKEGHCYYLTPEMLEKIE